MSAAALLDDLIGNSCDATWEVRVGDEMEDRIDAVNRDEMFLYAAADVFAEMRERLDA